MNNSTHHLKQQQQQQEQKIMFNLTTHQCTVPEFDLTLLWVLCATGENDELRRQSHHSLSKGGRGTGHDGLVLNAFQLLVHGGGPLSLISLHGNQRLENTLRGIGKINK